MRKVTFAYTKCHKINFYRIRIMPNTTPLHKIYILKYLHN